MGNAVFMAVVAALLATHLCLWWCGCCSFSFPIQQIFVGEINFNIWQQVTGMAITCKHTTSAARLSSVWQQSIFRLPFEGEGGWWNPACGGVWFHGIKLGWGASASHRGSCCWNMILCLKESLVQTRLLCLGFLAVRWWGNPEGEVTALPSVRHY